MVKFAERDDPNYLRVAIEIKLMIKTFRPRDPVKSTSRWRPLSEFGHQSDGKPFLERIYESKAEVPYTKDSQSDDRVGSDGFVYRATKRGGAYAVKTFTKVYKEDKRTAIRQECALVGMCSHTNVIRVVELYQVATNPSTFYVVLEPWV